MYKKIILKASSNLWRVHFSQMYDQLNEEKYLWGLKFNQETFDQRYPRGVLPVDLTETQVMELFSFFREKSSSWDRNYSPPDEFLILIEGHEIDFDAYADISDIPKLYRVETWGGDDNYIAVEFCNEVYLINLKTGLPLKTVDGEVLSFAPVFWERGSVYIDFISHNTFVARLEDRVNGTDNNLYRIENGEAVLIEENLEDDGDDHVDFSYIL